MAPSPRPVDDELDGPLPELRCPRCGIGLVSGHHYPSCADFPDAMRAVAHNALCRNFADDTCPSCDLWLAQAWCKR